jgi:hypothetical protein
MLVSLLIVWTTPPSFVKIFSPSFELEELIKLVNDTGLKVIESGEILVGEKPYSNFYIVAKN